MEDPKTNSILDEANRLFLTGKLREAIVYYDKILDKNPQHVSSLNNKGYALSKLKDFDNAIKCYDAALECSPDDLSLLVNKISSFRKQEKFVDALSICNGILENNSKYNIALYHKERILFSMGNYDESIECCDKILDDYPDNADVLFDKSCSFVMISKNKEALDLLERAISQGVQYKIKAKKSKIFEKLSNDVRYKKLIL
jgi:tetratricopeptide (TPR) repeat protein